MPDDPFWQAITAQGDAPSATFEAFHRGADHRAYQGTAEITVGTNWVAQLFLRLGGFPLQGGVVSAELEMTSDGADTRWVRRFGGHVTASRLRFDRQSGLVVERMGQLEIHLRSTLQDGSMCSEVAKLKCFGFPLPKWAVPVGDAIESATKEGFIEFDVQGKLPLIGMLIRYRGHFLVEPSSVQFGSSEPTPDVSRSL